jgi:hypothetical protein
VSLITPVRKHPPPSATFAFFFRSRSELDIAELVLKHLDKPKSSAILQLEDRGEGAKKIRSVMFGKYTKEQLEAASLTTT